MIWPACHVGVSRLTPPSVTLPVSPAASVKPEPEPAITIRVAASILIGCGCTEVIDTSSRSIATAGAATPPLGVTTTATLAPGRAVGRERGRADGPLAES